MMTLEDEAEILKRWRAARARTGGGPYMAMYSSWADGVVTDPAWMMAPVDDHLVHRGDGVFETLKVHGGALYNLGAHLDRLMRSAETIGIAPPVSRERLEAIVLETTRAGGAPDCLLRVIVSRGVGGFSVNPYEPGRAELYVVAYPSGPPFMAARPEGARVGISAIRAKPDPLVAIKTCNYIPNALMKKEAVDRGVDFMLALDAAGDLSESFTENLCLIDAEGCLRAPRNDQMLPGTTLARVFDLAGELVGEGVLADIRQESLRPDDLYRAREVLIAGTTAHVAAVVEVEGRPVGEGAPGPVHARLSALFEADMDNNAALRTVVFT